MSESQDAIEKRVREAFDAQHYERAATLTIEYYGPELLGFLIGHLRDEDAANEVFADFSEAFWEGLPRFEWRCSLRTWAYKLVRRSAGRFRKRARIRERPQPLAHLSHVSQLSQAIERVRTATAAYRRTDVKDRYQALRALLPEEDQALLVLRVDRGLSWIELAEVMLEDAVDAPDEARLKTEAARLRKRFQLAKDRLRELVAEAGLLDR